MTDSALQTVAKPVHEVVLEAGRADRHYWADLWTYRPTRVWPRVLMFRCVFV